MNKVILTGRLTKDIEVEMTSTNKMYVKNSIAVKNDFKNADGNYDSEFVNIVVWGNTADYLGKYAEKGMRVAVEGRLTTRSYDKQDGTKGYVTEVVCNNVELLDNKKDKVEENTSTEETQESDPYAEFGEQIEIDDNFLE